MASSGFQNNQTNTLLYKDNPSRLFSVIDIDLLNGKSYLIDGVEVLNSKSLGSSITDSKLTKVGVLKNLQVSGSLNVADHIFYNDATDRLGIGTDAPNAALGLVENNVELVVGSLKEGTGHIGTFSSSDLAVITDNVTRMTFSRTGKIIFGHPVAQNADVEIQGRLFVRQLVVDQNDNTNSPLEFKAADGGSNYGKGLLFTGKNAGAKQFILAANPDSFHSTEHINLDNTKSYLIAGQPVLSMNKLGNSVNQSNLTSVGTLVSLEVAGSTKLSGILTIENGSITIADNTFINANSVAIGNPLQNINISTQNISLGAKDVPTTSVVVNGTLAIGVQTISPDVNFETSGNIRFANRLFAVDTQIPVRGSFKKGDIVWNSNPVSTGYVGWVCVTDGTPGIWRGFGQIGIA
jgi:hypothetical protein